MFRFVIEDARKFKSAIDSVVALIDEGALDITPSGLVLKAMDPSQIAMVCFSMPKTAFVEYEVGDAVRVGLNFDNLSKILSRAQAGEKLEIAQEENKILIRFYEGKHKRSFKVPVLEMPLGAGREPNLVADCDIQMLGGTLKDHLRDAALVSTHVSLQAGSEGFKLECHGDSSDLLVEEEKDSPTLIKLTSTSPAKATFPLQYLEDISKGCPESAPITLHLKSNSPLKVEYEVEGAKLAYYLAPRIDSD
ncbi:DNA polymerase sliding clamp [uncultured archaeon]|nr:DNA polymerase sliding clamp [uncultured archaeon]